MSFLADVRYSVRSLSQHSGLAVTCFVVLALGIGANSAIFAAIRSIVFDSLPYRDPARLVRLYERGVIGNSVQNPLSPANFFDWQRDARGFEQMFAYGDDAGNLAGDPSRLPEHVEGEMCSWTMLRTLGVEPALGRAFSAGDDEPNAARTILLSDSLWRHRFNADPGVVGRTLRLDGEVYVIVGILPTSFEFPSATTQYWVPLRRQLPVRELSERGDHRLNVVARLRRGVSIRSANAELAGIAARIRKQYPGEITGSAAEIYPLQSTLVGRSITTSLYILWAAVSCVLLIACVNVANLLLTRSIARRREIAIRTALGASRARVLRLFLFESTLLGAAGACGGILLASWLTHLLGRIGGTLPRASAIHLDWATLFFAAGLAMLSGVAAGLFPALSGSSLDVNQAMHETSRASAGSARRAWNRNMLVGGELALSFLLLAAAGLLLKSFVLLQHVDVGFNTSHLLTMRISLPESKYGDEAKAAVFFDQLLERVRSLPGVRGAGLVSVLPVAGHYMDTTFTIAGRAPGPKGYIDDVIPRTADPGYFRAMGIPLIRGRFFARSERLEKANKVLISQSFARKYFSNENPMGEQLRFWGAKPWEIIGVVGDVRKNLDEPPEPTMYVPVASGVLPFASLVARTSGDPLSLAPRIEREIARLDPDLAVASVLTMDQLISKRTANQRFNLVLLISFAGLALALAAAGLYGVVSYSTAQRTSEFGIRLAIGAAPGDLVACVARQGLRPALVGMAVGLAASLGLVRLMQSMLFGVRAIDVPVLLSVGAGLLAVSILACLIPALRTTRIDPAQALRAE